MGDFDLVVAVFERKEHLREEPPRLLFRQRARIRYVIKELAALRNFEHNIFALPLHAPIGPQIIAGAMLQLADDVRVVEVGAHLDFGEQQLVHVFILYVIH